MKWTLNMKPTQKFASLKIFKNTISKKYIKKLQLFKNNFGFKMLHTFIIISIIIEFLFNFNM